MDQQDVNNDSESRPSSTFYHNMRRQRISSDQLQAENAARNARRRANYHARKHVSSSSARKGKSIIIDTSTSQHSQENEDPMNVDCRPSSSRTIFNDITNVINNESILYNGESSSSTHHCIVQNEASNIPQPIRTRETHTRGRTRERVYHRCSWNYHERNGLPMLQLSTPKPCCHCQSRLFHHESSQLCCQSGKVTLPSFQAPDELYSLYSDQTAIGAHFRHNIRKYNHVFSFTSMGVHVDESLANARSGAYAFKAQGAVYHRVGGFLPTESRPRFLQMYFYDTEHELEHRLSENRALRENLIQKIKEILDRHNPFVQNFRYLAQRNDLQHCRLIIHEQPAEQRQYCLPTASQVAGIIIGGEEVANLNDRDIIIESSAGHTMLVYCQPARVRDLWDEFFPYMAEDYLLSTSMSNTDDFIRNCVLHDMESLLKQLGKRIEDFDLPRLSIYMDTDMQRSRALFDEIYAPVPDEDLNCVHQLNTDQRHAFDTIMHAIDQNNAGVFFIDGPGGTGKTFLYRAILASVKHRGKYGLPTASSGIAATLLHRGKTAHKTFRIPIKLDASSMCAFSKQSIEGHLIKHASVIIWDEATMTHRYAFEAVDRSLRDLMGIDLPFGGKVMVFGGDFRQVLPVIPKGTIAETIDACFARSSLWQHVRVLKLKQNMRSRLDEEFASFLLRVGDGDEPTIEDSLIKLPPSITLSTHAENSIGNLIDFVFPNIEGHGFDVAYMVERAIVTPTNEDVMVINEKILENFVGGEHIYYSYDSVPDDTHNLYPQEFLNSLSFGGLPPHVLRLKVGSPIMLLRNIDANNGLCNGTRLICCQLRQHLIEAEILTGHCKGTRVFIPRIPLKTAEDAKLPFEMTRKQFPIKLCFALTINKAQGQTIPHVGIYLPQHVFSHGQLYVALSRGTSQHTTKVMVNHGHQGTEGVYTKNIVYKEVFNERI